MHVHMYMHVHHLSLGAHLRPMVTQEAVVLDELLEAHEAVSVEVCNIELLKQTFKCYAHAHVRVYVHIHTCGRAHVYMYMYMHICCTCGCRHVPLDRGCIHTCNVHVYIHLHVHICTLVSRS